MLQGDALWCDVPDIDLAFVHSYPPETRREVISLVDSVHLDILHYDRQEYEPARQVRGDARLGPQVYAARPLYDPIHFFDFVQASVRSQYDRPEYVHRRAAPALEAAREGWFALRGKPFSPAFMGAYLEIVEQSARGLAALAGVTLPARRFALLYRRAVAELGHEGLFSGFIGLLGGTQVESEAVAGWLPAWEMAWQHVSRSDQTPQWSAPRLAYFRSGIQALARGETPSAALWPLLHSWTQLVRMGGEAAPWEAACQSLGLTDPEERVAALDAYLDAVTDILGRWAGENGVG